MKFKAESIAGMSFSGGRKENYFFCQLKYYVDEKRWFLSSLKQVKEETSTSDDEIITNWINKAGIKELVVNFPLSLPLCQTCKLKCPGTISCHHPEVKEVRSQMKSLLAEDEKLEKENPKKYEQERIEFEKVQFTKSVLDKETSHHILSKSFKRKLKKGYIPYWNRPIDFWIWKNYYDQLLNLFSISFDSFGDISLMLMQKMQYLYKHFPKKLDMYETNIPIILVELHRMNIISSKNITELQSIDLNSLARVQIIRAIEQKLNIFIYTQELELMSKNAKAFESFLLALAGKNFLESKTREIGLDEKFIVPDFS